MVRPQRARNACPGPKSEERALDRDLVDRSNCALGGGRSRELPGGICDGLVMLDEHFKSVDIMAA